MKNRVRELCFEKGIYTPEEFAIKTGLGVMRAKAIWDEQTILEYSLIEHLTAFFECSTAYLLCVDDKEA